MSRLVCHDLTAILHILILKIKNVFLDPLKLLSSLDSLNSVCRSFSNLKTVTAL